MAQITAGTATLAKWAVIPAALIVSGIVVSQASYSAFSATVTEGENNWTTGTVQLTKTSGDAQTGVATFNAGNLAPNSTGFKCITVTSTGSLNSTVKLRTAVGTYSSPVKGVGEQATTLGKWITVTVTQGTGGTPDCNGFSGDAGTAQSVKLDALGTVNTNFATGISPWATTGGSEATRTYQIAYKLDPQTPNTLQESTASVDLIWEAQNDDPSPVDATP